MASPERSIYIFAESHSIAKPFLSALDLKRSEEMPKLRCYASKEVLLVESRGGPAARAGGAEGKSPAVEAAAASSFLLGRGGFDESTRFLHLGCCTPFGEGGRELVGRVVLVNQVREGTSGRGYFPDILLAHEFPEAGVHTAATTPPRGERGDHLPLADRELSGFLSAALTFLAPHQVYCLAAVVEEQGTFEEKLFGGAAEAILRLVGESRELSLPAAARLLDAAERSLDAVGAALGLTAAQTRRLRGLAEAASAGRHDVAALLEPWLDRTLPHTKQERRRMFDELERAFKACISP